MTPQEAIQALVDAGWPLLTAQEAVANLDPPVSSPSAGIEVLGQVNQVELDLLLEAGPTVEGKEVSGPAPLGLAEGESNPLLISGLEKLNDPRPAVQESITPEEQAEIDAATPEEYNDATTLLAEIAGEGGEVNYDWVHQVVAVGSLDSNEALIAFYEKYVEIEAPADVKTDEDEIVAEAKSILSRGRQNESVFFALTAWGQASGNYVPTRQTDGVNNSEIMEMVEKYDIDIEQATSIGRIANSLDMEPLDLAQIWDNFGPKDREFVVSPEAKGFPNLMFAKRGIIDVARLYKQGLVLYDESHLMASIHVGAPGLAVKLRSDPYSLDSGELQAALDAIGGGEGREGDAQVNWIKQRLAGGFRASAEVDKESMRNAVQVLADGWNLTGTEAIVGALTAELVSQAVARVQASLPNPFGPLQEGVNITDTIQDQAAHVKRRLRATPEYKELFAHLAGGEAEEEFVRRFENRSQQVLGDDVVGAVRAAMRTGNVNTIFQQGLNTPVGESSTRFQEIIARNAQTFRDML